jgi:hypothetical protein
MPRSLDPSSRLTMVLACDVDKPKETQPRIFARTLTLNQQRKLMTAMDAMKKAEAPEDKIEGALNAAEVCLTGWENMIDPQTGNSIPFTRENIGDVLSLDELIEVFGAVTAMATPSADDKKKSESPLSSGAENSVNHASGNAGT